MKLKLTKIQFTGGGQSFTLTMEVQYDYTGRIWMDAVKISHQGKAREPWISARMTNPGVALVIERIIDVMPDIDYSGDMRSILEKIIETLSHDLKMEIQPETAGAVLKDHGIDIE